MQQVQSGVVENSTSASAAQPVDVSDATAQAANEEECFRAVVDLREAAQKLDKLQFESKAKILEAQITKRCLYQATNCSRCSIHRRGLNASLNSGTATLCRTCL